MLGLSGMTASHSALAGAEEDMVRKKLLLRDAARVAEAKTGDAFRRDEVCAKDEGKGRRKWAAIGVVLYSRGWKEREREGEREISNGSVC